MEAASVTESIIQQDAETVHSAALKYHKMGLCVVPVLPDEKRVGGNHGRWKHFQTKRPSLSTLRNWFRDASKGYRVGLLLGEASRGLCCRDFDTDEGLQEWRESHSELAAQLPISLSRRGGQVWFRQTDEQLREVRARLGKLGGNGPIFVEGAAQGELRIGSGCLCVVPPSPHPEGIYQWLQPLPEDIAKLTCVDVFSSELLPSYYFATLHRHSETHDTQETQDSVGIRSADLAGALRAAVGDCPCFGALYERVAQAMSRAMPSGVGHRQRQIFRLCREFKAIDELAGKEAYQLEPLFHLYYSESKAMLLSPVMSRGEAFGHFAAGLPKVAHAAGCDEISTAWREAMQNPIPVCAERFSDSECQWLVMLCCELQRRAGRKPFYLDCRTAGRLLGETHTTANARLNGMLAKGVLKLAKPHVAQRKAREFFYLGDDPTKGDAYEP